MIVKWAAVKDTVLKVHFTEQNFAEKLSPQAEEQVRNISNKVAVEKEVLNNDNVANGWQAIFMSSYNSELPLWKEDYTMSAMGNRCMCCFEEVNGKVW